MCRGGDRRSASWVVYDFDGANGPDFGSRRSGDRRVVNRRTKNVYSAANKEYGGTRNEIFNCTYVSIPLEHGSLDKYPTHQNYKRIFPLILA